jgi:hypothetical protein
MLHAVSLVMFIVAAVAAALAWRELNRRPPETSDHTGPAPARLRFMAIAGIVLGTGFALLILASEIPNLILRSCD